MATIEKGPSGRIRGLRVLLRDLNSDDVLTALSNFSLDKFDTDSFGESTDYDLLHDGKRYPPKAILGLAAKRVLGRVLTSDEFAGGEKSACFVVLKSAGFEIVRKADSSQLSSSPKRFIQYDRKEISQIFEPGGNFTQGAGRWGGSGIIEYPPDSRNFIFEVTLGSPSEGNPYRDELTEDGFLIWESQTRHKLSSPVIEKLLNHDPLESNIHLFLRSTRDTPYTYLGLLEYFSHDPNTSEPVHFTWKILNWDLDRTDLDRLVLTFRPPLDPGYSSPTPVEKKKLTLVQPPVTKRRQARSTKRSGVQDWAAQDERNGRLGLQGEKLVFQYEQDSLSAAGRKDLAADVRHVALTDSSAGYDILSFLPDGTKKRIEVKTTPKSGATPFFISINEVLVSREDPETYWIYRLYDFDSQDVKFFILNGDAELTSTLVAIKFRAYPNTEH